MKFVIFTISCVMILSVAPNLVAQQIYTWIDENGVTHITDTPPPPDAELADIVEYKEKSPQEQEAIDRKIQQQRQRYERQDQIEAARHAEAEARKAEKRARTAVERAREQTQDNQEYIRKLSNRKWKRKKFRKRIRRLKHETEAAQSEAEALVEQAEIQAKKAKAAAARETR